MCIDIIKMLKFEVCCGMLWCLLRYAVVCCGMLQYAVVCCGMRWYAVVCAKKCHPLLMQFLPFGKCNLKITRFEKKKIFAVFSSSHLISSRLSSVTHCRRSPPPLAFPHTIDDLQNIRTLEKSFVNHRTRTHALSHISHFTQRPRPLGHIAFIFIFPKLNNQIID